MDSITIRGYKSFKDITVSLGKINILIGSNGAGKSNFLSIFELLKHTYEGSIGRRVILLEDADKLFHKGNQNTNRISIEVKEGESTYAFDLVESNGSLVMENERLDCSFTPDKRNGYKIETNQMVTREINKEDLAVSLFDIKNYHPFVYKRIIRVIQSVAPFFNDFVITSNENGDVRLFWKDKYSDTIYGPNDLSEGTIRFIVLAVLFMQPNIPELIIIDEPELGLHPVAVEKLAGLIKSAANRGAQVIAATQNTELISNFEPSDILTVDQCNGQTEIKRLETKDYIQWLNDNTMGDLWLRRMIKGGQSIC